MTSESRKPGESSDNVMAPLLRDRPAMTSRKRQLRGGAVRL
jgi:hypothetical protein